jgi:hypothetical protein
VSLVNAVVCKYCQKEFRRESTLSAHICEAKRRHQQRDETGVQFGYRAYLQFYETTQGSAKLKTYEDFAASPYYLAFVRYGRYLVSIRVINSSDKLYEEWLLDYLRRENAEDALERGLEEMRNYAESFREVDGSCDFDFSDYFRRGNSNRICQHIVSGRISPWVIYNCDSGVSWLADLSPALLSLIMAYIDPDYWSRRLQDFLGDTEWSKHILSQAGL